MLDPRRPIRTPARLRLAAESSRLYNLSGRDARDQLERSTERSNLAAEALGP